MESAEDNRREAVEWIRRHDILCAHYPNLAQFALQKAIQNHNEAQRKESEQTYERTPNS